MVDISQAVINAAITIGLLVPIVIYIGNKFLAKAFDAVSEIFAKPAVAKAMGIIGKHSGEVRGNAALQNEIATSIINKTIGPFKLIAEKALGIDIDGMIEEHGAMEVLQTLQSFLPMLKGMGIDIGNLNLESILGQVTGQQPQTSNTEMT